MTDVKIKLADADEMLFDVQTALLNSGICEKGIDDIECNAMLIRVFKMDDKKEVHTLFNQLLLSKDNYSNAKDLMKLNVAKDMLAYNEQISQIAKSLCNTAEKENYEWVWKNVMMKEVKYNTSIDIEWPTKLHFCIHNFLGFNADDGIFFCCDERLIVMKRRGCNRILLVRFE